MGQMSLALWDWIDLHEIVYEEFYKEWGRVADPSAHAQGLLFRESDHELKAGGAAGAGTSRTESVQVAA